MRTLILTEAGQDIGLGHFFRMQALGNALSHWTEIIFFLDYHGTKPETFSHDLKENIFFSEVNWKKHLDIAPEDVDLIIIDSYLVGTRLCQELKTLAPVVMIDDYVREEYAVDLIINLNILFSPQAYQHLYPAIPSVGGPAFTLLRKAFTDVRGNYLVRRKLERVLLMAGGEDSSQLLPLLIETLQTHFSLEVVAGKENYAASLKARYPHVTVFGFLTASNILKRMQISDIFVSAAGQSLNEAICYGIPTLGIVTGPDQIKHLKALVEKNIIPEYLEREQHDLGSRLTHLLQNYSKRERIAYTSRGKQYIDGNGAYRCSEALKKLITASS